MRPTTLVLALCFVPAAGLLIPLATLEAQLQPGQRVRITAPEHDLDKYNGTVRAMDNDTLVVDRWRVALLSVTRLDVHRGRKSRVGRGALIGSAIGAAGGIATAAAACQTGGISACRFTPAGVYGGAAAVGAAGGALIGVIIGALIKSDRWEEVSLDQLRVSFAPQRDGRFALGLSVRF